MRINLTQNRYAIVDKEDYAYLSQFKWSYAAGYAVRSKRVSKDKVIQFKMHREILKAPKESYVDHIDGNPLDNRRSNLRLCTNQQNQWNAKWKTNTTGHKGIDWMKNKNYWRVRISTPEGRLFIGSFKHLADAIEARDGAYAKYHGEFSCV